MCSFIETTEIAVAPSEVWNAIHEYEHRLEWDRMLRDVAVDGVAPKRAAAINAGSEVTQWARWAAGGVMMKVRYLVSRSPTATAAGYAKVEMIRGPWFFRAFTARSELIALDAGSTRSVAKYEFECGPKWLRWVIEPIVLAVFRRETTSRWASLKRYLEVRG